MNEVISIAFVVPSNLNVVHELCFFDVSSCYCDECGA